MELTVIGKRKQIVNGDVLSAKAGYLSSISDMPAHFNLNLTGRIPLFKNTFILDKD